jgi:hypothetical protein
MIVQAADRRRVIAGIIPAAKLEEVNWQKKELTK